MPDPVKILRSTSAGAVPSSLVSGQIAINEADGKIFWLDANGVAIRSATLKGLDSNISDLINAINSLGSAASLSASDVLRRANNLSDVANAATARSNLGLSALATTTPGAGVATALGNAPNAANGIIVANASGNVASPGTIADSTGVIRPKVSAASVVSTSGAAIDFTGIPSWAKRITMMLQGVSTNGTNGIIVQLGTSGGIITSGYLGSAATLYGVYFSEQNITSGLAVDAHGAFIVDTAVRHGQMIISNLSGNNWVSTSITGHSDRTQTTFAGSSISLGGVLTQLRLTTVGGANTFDAGSVNIMYE